MKVALSREAVMTGFIFKKEKYYVKFRVELEPHERTIIDKSDLGKKTLYSFPRTGDGQITSFSIRYSCSGKEQKILIDSLDDAVKLENDLRDSFMQLSALLKKRELGSKEEEVLEF